MRKPSEPPCWLSPIRAKPSKTWVLLPAALLLTLAATAALAAPPKPLQVEAGRGQLKELHGRIETLRRDLAKSEETRAEAADQLKETESAISDINRGLRELGGVREKTQAELSGLEGQSQRLETRIAAQQAQLSRLLYGKYLNGETDALQLVLSGADPNQAARDLHYLSLLSIAQANLLRLLRGTLAEKQLLAEALRAKHGDLVAIEQKRQQQKAALLGRQQQRQEVLAKLSGKIKLQRREIDTLKHDEKRLGVLIEGLSRIVAKPAKAAPALRNEKLPEALGFSGNFAKLKGRLRLPSRGTLANRFGTPRAGGGATWKGVFIRAAEGVEVKAVAPGRVVFADWLRGFGNLIIVDHGDGYLSVYGNSQSLYRRLGDTVKGGETVAAVGNSGGNPESGLYFELRHQGLAIDPLKWVNLK